MKDGLLLFKKNAFDFIYTNIILQHIDPQYSNFFYKNGGVIIDTQQKYWAGPY